jgi:hypothetical protein
MEDDIPFGFPFGSINRSEQSWLYKRMCFLCTAVIVLFYLTLSDPTSDLVRQYDFLFLLRCRKMSDTGFVAFVRPLSEPVLRFSSCSTDFSQQIAQVVLFLFLRVFSFKTVG